MPPEFPTPRAEPSRGLLLLTGALLLFAAVALSVRIWSHLCDFPANPWNDMRLAASVALARGVNVYSSDTHGVINTWTYGPLPLFYFLPVSLASTAAGALQIGAWLNLALTLVPLLLVCFAWPTATPAPHEGARRAGAFLLCLTLWPDTAFVHFSDHLAVALGLLGSLCLARSRCPFACWLAAFTATGALACKQTTVGLALAQIAWLGATVGWREGARQTWRCVVAGGIIGGVAIAIFGWEPLYYTLLQLPSKFPWVSDIAERLASVGPALVLHVGLPALALAVWRHRFREPSWRLPALLWLFALPFGLMALLKSGGRMNSMHGFLLWLPPVATLLFTTSTRASRDVRVAFTAAALILALASGKILSTDPLPLRPQIAAYEEAVRIAEQLPGQVWFPIHPLVTLYSDGRYYHDEDGLFVRRLSRHPAAPEHVAAHLPPAMRAIAFGAGWSDWGIADKMIPQPARSIPRGAWSVVLSPRPSANP